MTTAESPLRVDLTPPPGWTTVDPPVQQEGTRVTGLTPADWPEDWGLRPSLVLTVGAPTDDSVRALATESVATLLADVLGCRVVAYEPWQDESGRRLLTTYPSGDALVCSTTWLRLHDRTPVAVTATVDADRYTRVIPLLEDAVATLRVDEEAGRA